MSQLTNISNLKSSKINSDLLHIYTTIILVMIEYYENICDITDLGSNFETVDWIHQIYIHIYISYCKIIPQHFGSDRHTY